MYLPFPVDGNVDINSLPIGFNDADADGADCAADVADCTGDDSSAVDSADAGDFLPGDFLPGFVGAAPSAPSATGDTCVCADGACVDGAGAGPAKIDVNEDETSFCGGNSRGA